MSDNGSKDSAKQDQITSIKVNPGKSFVETPYLTSIINRALSYLNAGFPVHLLGPTGSGKTTLALHISQMIGRPTMLVYGDDEFSTSDLVGTDTGYSRKKTVDNYIHSVLKVEESVNQHWVDNRLTVACREGYTLLYDEFTRSRPEANNALLSVLAEGVLVLPARRGQNGYIKVHPEFKAIFTSNPEEYVGTHRTQDALMDRMITINIPGLDYDTEVAIAVARSGLPRSSAMYVVSTIHAMRASDIIDHPLSVRAAIMISRILAFNDINPKTDFDFYIQTCFDVLKVHKANQKDQLVALLKGKTS